jgi:hypothetical protein
MNPLLMSQEAVLLIIIGREISMNMRRGKPKTRLPEAARVQASAKLGQGTVRKYHVVLVIDKQTVVLP